MTRERFTEPSPVSRTVDRQPVPPRALARAVGNRATARALARWAAHPDKDKKGMFLPDVVAADFMRFNPPKNE